MKKGILAIIKDELEKWKIELKNKLASNNKNISKNLYIIDKEWLNNFEESYLSSEHNNFDLKKKEKENKLLSFNDMKLKLKEKFFKNSSSTQNIEIFVLNETCYNSFQLNEKDEGNIEKIKGNFYNKLLLFQMKNASQINHKNLCIFFLDNQHRIRQGYLSVDEKNIKEIKNEFQKSEPITIFDKYNISVDDNKIMKTVPNKFSLYIFQIYIKKMKKEEPNLNIINIERPSSKKLNVKKINIGEDIKLKFKLYYENNENNFKKSLKKININNIKNNKHFIKHNFKIKKEEKQQEKISVNDRENPNNMLYKRKNIFLNNIVKGKEKDNYKNKLLNAKKENNINNKGDILPLKKVKIIQKDSSNKKEKVGNNVNKIEEPNIQIIPFIPEKYEESNELPKPIIKGLSNIGATCYMNATLQCFSHVERLRYFLLDEYTYKELFNEKNTNKKLTFAFAEVLKNLWNENSKQGYYSPEYFKQVISDMNPLFKGVAANDSKDLILFLLENIHKELNTQKGNNIINNNQEPNSSDFNSVYLHFINNYRQSNDSIIIQEFYGYYNVMSSCVNCNNAVHNVQSFNILFFPLEEVRKFKNYDINRVSILDCFDYYQKIDLFNSFYCNFCRGDSAVYSQTRLVDTPKTLIINLNRGYGLQFNVDIIFDEYLDLRNYIYNPESPSYYELIGMLCHYGSNDMGGHFIAFCKHSQDGKWYKYNDAIVNQSSFEEVCNSGLPYVLFYSYIQV